MKGLLQKDRERKRRRVVPANHAIADVHASILPSRVGDQTLAGFKAGTSRSCNQCTFRIMVQEQASLLACPALPWKEQRKKKVPERRRL